MDRPAPAAEPQRDPLGRLVLPLAEDDDLTLLRKAGDAITDVLLGEPLDRFHAPDQKYWDYRLRGRPITLHWVRGGGLSVVAGDTEPDTEVLARDVCVQLRREIARGAAG